MENEQPKPYRKMVSDILIGIYNTTGGNMTEEDCVNCVKAKYAEVLAEGYVVDDNNEIISPGRFQGEKNYVLYYAKILMEDGPDYEDSEGEAFFEITPEEREVFPNLPDAPYLSLQTTNDGFIISNSHHVLPED